MFSICSPREGLELEDEAELILLNLLGDLSNEVGSSIKDILDFSL